MTRLPFAAAWVGCGVFLNVYTTQALLPELSSAFHASSVAVAVTVSATTLAMALCSPLVGVLADAAGRKLILVGALLLLGPACLLIARAGTLSALIGWRFVQGALIPGVSVVMTAYIAEEAPAERLAPTLAAYISGTVLGGFGGRLLSGLIAQAAGWRAAFVALAALDVLVALVAWALLPASRAFVPQRARDAWPALRAHLRNPRLLAACAVGFGVLFALVGAFTFINFHLAAAPYRLRAAALGSIFAVYLLGVVVTPPSGRWALRLGRRRVLAGALSVSALGFALTLLSPLPLIVLGLALGSSGIFVAQATATGYVALSVQRARSLAAGLYNAAYYAGGAAGAVLVGVAYTRLGWPGAVGAVACALAFALGVGLLAWQDA